MEILDNSSIILSYYIQVYTYVTYFTYTRNSIKFDPICLHWSNSNAGKMDQTWSYTQQLFRIQTSPGQSTIDAADNIIRINQPTLLLLLSTRLPMTIIERG